MERDIRRRDRALTEEETRTILETCEYGTLSVTEAGGQPYAVPLSYTVLNNSVYIHCALTGRKVEAFTPGTPACFTCVGAIEPVFENGSFGTYYESAMVFGPIRKIEDEKERHDALIALCRKYLPANIDTAEDYLRQAGARTAVYALSIERLTGKAKRKKAF